MKLEVYTLEALLKVYQKAINRIDDYFEYACESEQDQEFVHDTLDELTKSIIDIESKL